MSRNRMEEVGYRQIAGDLGLDPLDVRQAVHSFFDIILEDARTLPLDNPRKIYSRKVFNSMAAERVRSIPYLGRLGPTYTRYLKWRANESCGLDILARPKKMKALTSEEIEELAKAVLAGQTYVPDKNRKSPYQRIWLVGEDGKKQARQVIKKK